MGSRHGEIKRQLVAAESASAAVHPALAAAHPASAGSAHAKATHTHSGIIFSCFDYGLRFGQRS